MAGIVEMVLSDLLRKSKADRDADFLWEGMKVLGETLMALEVTQHLSTSP